MRYLEVLLEALVDTAKMLPVLFLVYYLIELLEFKCAKKMQNSYLLKGKASPIFGSMIGCIPQCGFSVVSADLFSKGVISVGAFIAVCIATSDEAIPLMFADVKAVPWMLLLVGIKIIVAVIVGYLSIALYKLIFRQPKKMPNTHKKDESKHEHDEHHDHNERHGFVNEHTHEEEPQELHGGCCHHHVESKSFDWLHPLLHSLKIGLFILIINYLFNIITHVWIGEENLKLFLTNSVALQPLLAVLIGLIPNCVSSVCLTELFLLGLGGVGGLRFGALVAGLCVNAGLGMIMLIKQNKNVKENIFILTVLILSSLTVGYSLLFIV